MDHRAKTELIYVPAKDKTCRSCFAFVGNAKGNATVLIKDREQMLRPSAHVKKAEKTNAKWPVFAAINQIENEG